MPPQKESRYLVHRKDEYDALVKASGIVVLHGPARCGKTTLLKKLAEDDKGIHIEFRRSDTPETFLKRLTQRISKFAAVEQDVYNACLEFLKALDSLEAGLPALVKARFTPGDFLESLFARRVPIVDVFLRHLRDPKLTVYVDGFDQVATRQEIVDLTLDILAEAQSPMVLGVRDETLDSLDLTDRLPIDTQYVRLDRFTEAETKRLLDARGIEWDPEVHRRWRGDPGWLYLATEEAATLEELRTIMPGPVANEHRRAYRRLSRQQKQC
ncbi:unnamed protein product, partial [marine sediment metagenome]